MGKVVIAHDDAMCPGSCYPCYSVLPKSKLGIGIGIEVSGTRGGRGRVRQPRAGVWKRNVAPEPDIYLDKQGMPCLSVPAGHAALCISPDP